MSESTFFIPKTADEWNELWMARQSERINMNHDEAFWNERAKTFNQKDTPGSYTEQFLKLAGIRPHESVIDMGCGTGNLSVPLGREGHEVLACDFSSVMLERLSQALDAQGIRSVRPLLLSWDDDWAKHGVKPDSCDIGFASRSIITHNLLDALRKLTATARRRCCITMATGCSPRVDDCMLREIGLSVPPSYDDVFAIAMLQADGFLPTLDYIPNERYDRFDSFETALAKYTNMATAAAQEVHVSEAELTKCVQEWLKHELVEEEADGSIAFVTRRPRVQHWAFIAWDK